MAGDAVGGRREEEMRDRERELIAWFPRKDGMSRKARGDQHHHRSAQQEKLCVFADHFHVQKKSERQCELAIGAILRQRTHKF
ncbi:MAG TPA: hypothetical protein VJL82_09725 [Rhizomicrobium sp.]|nr:hypothetical protein [Rhizomicrobium sp.]